MEHQAQTNLTMGGTGGLPAKWVLCAPDGWEHYISLEFHEIHLCLAGLGWTLLRLGTDDEAEIPSILAKADVVLLWEGYEFVERHACALRRLPPTVQRVVFCDDVHHFTPQRRQQRLRAFLWADSILATYPDKLRQWYPEVAGTTVHWTPHSAAACFRPGPAPTSDKVLLSGSDTWPYPFRQFCRAKLPSSLCEVVSHPGYPGYPGDKANTQRADQEALHRLGREGYATLLQAHPAMLACGSIFGYLVAKVFEAMASGCLVIAERVSLGERLDALGFTEGEDYIGTDIFTVIEDAARVRDAYLKGDVALRRMAENARRKVASHHSTACRAAQIHRTCIGNAAP